jgi:hypothetical protein
MLEKLTGRCLSRMARRSGSKALVAAAAPQQFDTGA